MELAGHPALVVRPRGARALYVMAHGAGAGMRHPFLAAMAAALGRRKIATLRWDFDYMAAGRAMPPRAPAAEAEVRAVWDAVPTDLPRYAGGKSYGGRMTSRAHASRIGPLPGLCGLVFLGFPLHPPRKPAVERAEHLAAITTPMLFVQGSRDELAELALLRPIVGKLPSATLHVVDGADHGFTRTPPDELADAIAAWIP